jgi:hypothetical protein
MGRIMSAPKVREIYGQSANICSSSVIEYAKSLLIDNNTVPINSNSIVGIEVEVENVNSWTESRIWQPKEDGSLRNKGVEYISKPLPATLVPQALTNLYNHILPTYRDFSNRTSIHVHLDVTDLTEEQVNYLIFLYVIFENSFYRIVKKERKKNIFCVPIQESSLIRNLSFNRIPHFGDFRWYKYCGLNVLPVPTLGTVEFRHLHGTDNLHLICNWVGLITKLKDFIVNSDLDYLLSSIKYLNTNSKYLSFTQDVFKEFSYLIYEDRNFTKEMEVGISILKAYIFSAIFNNELCLQYNNRGNNSLRERINLCQKGEDERKLDNLTWPEFGEPEMDISLADEQPAVQVNPVIPTQFFWQTANISSSTGTGTVNNSNGDYLNPTF